MSSSQHWWLVGGLIAFGLNAGACSSQSLEAGDAFEDGAPPADELEIETPVGWVGNDVGAAAPKLRRIGHAASFIDVKAAEPVLSRPRVVDARLEVGVPRVPRVLNSKLRAMGPDGTIYDVLATREEVEAVAARVREQQDDGASEPSEPFEPSITTLTLSNGVDNRSRWVNSSSDFPRDTIGQVTPGCTGTLFEQKLVLTAFHCLLTESGSWVSNFMFIAGRDGTSKPYGETDHTWKYWDQAFIDGGCYDEANYTDACAKYDWAVLVLANQPKSSGGATPGYMGIKYTSSDSAVAGYTKFHKGYAGCLDVDHPVENGSCIWNSLWGQTTACVTGTFFGAVGGWNRLFWHGCDQSGGHSGGPLFSWSPGSHGPYIVATSLGSGAADPHGATPNVAFRLDKAIGDALLYWRSIY